MKSHTHDMMHKVVACHDQMAEAFEAMREALVNMLAYPDCFPAGAHCPHCDAQGTGRRALALADKVTLGR